MTPERALQCYVTRLGDNALILGQRLIEWVTRLPELEEELANANIALDCIGQARMFYTYAGELEGKDRREDDFAFLRAAGEFQNFQLVEQPNGHFGDLIVRQLLFEQFYVLQLEVLAECSDQRLAEIAARAVREARYHLRHVSHWFVRLGDGTEESQTKVQQSLNDLWRYTGELFTGDEVDTIVRDRLGGPDLTMLRENWQESLARLAKEGCLTLPEDGWMAAGGRQGIHTEHLGYLIAEMQHLPRSHPGASW